MARTVTRLELPIAAGRVELRATDEDGTLDVIRGGNRVGTIAAHVEDGALVVRVLEIDAAFRGYGLGSEAARALVRAAATHGFERVRALAPPDRGLAVYFWFRMGLRPLPGGEPGGGLWLERDLTL